MVVQAGEPGRVPPNETATLVDSQTLRIHYQLIGTAHGSHRFALDMSDMDAYVQIVHYDDNCARLGSRRVVVYPLIG